MWTLEEYLELYPDAVPVLDKDGNKIISPDGRILYKRKRTIDEVKQSKDN